MTTADEPQTWANRVPTTSQATAMAVRGRALLLSGAVGTHLLAIVAIVIMAILQGRAGAISAALGAVVVLLFRVIGQQVQIGAVNRPGGQQMATVLGSFVIRMLALLVLLLLWFNAPVSITERLSGVAIGVGVLAAELGWLAGMLVTSFRQRTPIYDELDEVETTPAGER